MTIKKGSHNLFVYSVSVIVQFVWMLTVILSVLCLKDYVCI